MASVACTIASIGTSPWASRSRPIRSLLIAPIQRTATRRHPPRHRQLRQDGAAVGPEHPLTGHTFTVTSVAFSPV